MGFWSGICSAVSSVCSFVSSACSAIGGAVARACGAVAESILKMSPNTIGEIIKVIVAIAGACLGMGEDEKIEDYGAAMRQAEKKPEDFNTIQEYIAYLREEIKSGRIDLSSPKSEIEQFADKALGASLMIKGIDEKYKLKTSVDFWGTMGKKFEEGKINEKELDSVLKNCGDKQVDADNVSRYLNNEDLKGGQTKSEVSSIIVDSLKEANPKMSDSEVTTRFNNAIKQG